MKKYRTAAAFAGVGIALSASACGSGTEAPPAPDTTNRTFPPNVRAALEQTRQETIDYWTTKGIAIGMENFVFLEGNASVPNECNETITGKKGKKYEPKENINSGDAIFPVHCPKDDKIIINPLSVQVGLSEGARPNSLEAVALAAVIVRHETGHHMQLEEGIYFELSDLDAELQADCYAGRMTAIHDPADYETITEFYRRVNNGDEKLEHFNRGFSDVIGQGQICENYS